jgi:peptidoglycan/LPS O-acetylase OafA/YrhL
LNTRTAFRNDINGLRAWAVIAVILYHFGIPGFAGGFVGVDVFFVISGFLMTGIVVKGLEQNRFTFLGFYMARARRIAPALIVLAGALIAMGWLLLLPPDYKTLSTHTIYSLSFLSNIEFWLEAGYFDSASHEKWLLHTWSLSVEWQFYLVLPVVLWAVWHLRPGRTPQIWALAIGLLVSLTLCIWTTNAAPSTAFYLLHTRAWEMLGGGCVFLGSHTIRPREIWNRWLEGIGLLLIVMAVVIFDSNSAWPGWRAMVPALGAIVVLLANRTSVWTGCKLAQWLGDRSYSLYLWHWPVSVALVYAGQQNSIAVVGCGLLVTCVLGHLSFLYVENPARRLLNMGPQWRVAAVLLVPLVAVVSIAMYSRSHDGIAGRFSPSVELAAAEANNSNPIRQKCHPSKGSTSPSCVLGGNEWTVIALGDSHVASTISALAQAGESSNAGVVWWAYSGCPFVPKMRKTASVAAKLGHDYRCYEFIDWVQARIDTVPVNVPVVIVGRYAAAGMGVNESGLTSQVPDVYFTKEYSSTTAEFLNEFAQEITISACELAKRRTVYMVRPIPEMGVNVPQKLSRRMAWGFTEDISISMDEYQRRNAWVWAAQDAAHNQCGIKILDPIPYLCNESRCYGSKSGRPLYFDDNHLSEFGNKLLVPMFAEVFQAKKLP